MTPPTATALDAGDCSHCRGLDWGFLLRLNVHPMHKLSSMYSMETWDTMSQTAPTDKTGSHYTFLVCNGNFADAKSQLNSDNSIWQSFLYDLLVKKAMFPPHLK